jgi:hypothetical protein
VKISLTKNISKEVVVMSQIGGLLSLSKNINSSNNNKVESNDNKKYLEDMISKIKQTTTLSNKNSTFKIKSN